ncbi:MAG: hypothetical protein IJU95_04115 [Treponema sp.]|nr:hypothetical protein [Treponema sp.]
MNNVFKAGVFSLLLAMLFFQVSYLYRGPLAHTRGNLSGFYACRKNSLDLVFVGTSGTFSAFCPMDAWEQFGFASYNFCVNCMSTNAMPYALTEIVKTQKPKVVAIDVHSFIRRNRTMEISERDARYNTDAYRYSLNRFRLIHDCVPKSFGRFSYYFDIVKYHDSSFSRGFAINGARHNVDKGFNNLQWGVVEAPVMTAGLKALEEPFDSDLTALIERCRKLKVKVLFFTYPYGNFREDSIACLNYIKKRVQEAGFDFLDCEEFIGDFSFDYTRDYWEGAHFNIYGAQKVTALVGALLKERYGLPDRRSDARYSKWNEELSSWHENVVKYKEEIDCLRRKGMENSNP